MKHLYLMRHGQTLYNTKRYVQGHCDSPLTETGKGQADAAAAWLVAHDVKPGRIITSPLGRAVETAQRVASVLKSAGMSVPSLEPCDGIIERSYGSLEAGPAANVPGDLWDPGEDVAVYGGEGSRALRTRMVHVLTDAMEVTLGTLLAISHGSASLQFLKSVAEQEGRQAPSKLPNCAIFHFTDNESTRQFSLVEIVDPAA